jgi:NTE family protein
MDSTPPSIVLILGDAGIKSLAALPLVNFLLSQNVTVQKTLGSGAGAVLGALIASLADPSKISEAMARIYQPRAVSKLSYTTLLSEVGIPLFSSSMNDSLFDSSFFKEQLRTLFKEERIEDLRIPLSVQTTNFTNVQGIELTSGPLWEALYASNALYPLFPPQEIQGEWLVAGSFFSTLPLLNACKEKTTLIVAINIDRSGEVEHKSLAEFVGNTIIRSLAFSQLAERILVNDFLESPIYFISIPFHKNIGLWDSHATSDILTAGEASLARHKATLLEKILHPPPS